MNLINVMKKKQFKKTISKKEYEIITVEGNIFYKQTFVKKRNIFLATTEKPERLPRKFTQTQLAELGFYPV